MKKLSLIRQIGLWVVAPLVIAAGGMPGWAQQPPPQIAGTTRQLTTNPAAQIAPAISGNIVVWTDYRNGDSEVFYYDLGTGFEHQATSSGGGTSQNISDVSGNTIVYTEFSFNGAVSGVKAFVIGGSTSSVSSDGTSFNPGISGSLVAWVDSATGTDEIHAKDLSTGTVKTLTNNPGNDSTTPNVSGRLIAYSTKNSTTCQVFVTNFDTGISSQLTNSATGCNSSVDISGTHVVYQADRGGSTGQDIFVYDLVTGSETAVALAGLQRNPHVSGDWVAFEDVLSTGVSSILLYHIPSGTVFNAVTANSTLDAAYLNDIDGNRIAYTSDAAGNADIYVFEFTPPICTGGNTSFGPDTNFAVGSGRPLGTIPYHVAVGDFNGDGKLDLAATDQNGRSVIILLGDGTGSLTAAAGSPFATGGSPTHVVMGDFNGDGKLDLVTANDGTNSVSILLGNGDGTFRTATQFGVGPRPFFVVEGDFNGDGKLDLATANSGNPVLDSSGDIISYLDSSVSILLGNGDGTFRAPLNFTVGMNPDYIAVGDFNGDGKLDLAVATAFSGTVSILLGDGTGSFNEATGSPLTNGGASVFSVAVGDFDGDGKLDLAFGPTASFGISILLGNGNGTFGTATNFAFGAGPISLAIGDFNRDGKLDLAMADPASGTASVLLGNGDGTFGPLTNYGPVTNNVFYVTVGDFNGDGKLDLATASPGINSVSILLNTTTLTCQTDFSLAPIAPVTVQVGGSGTSLETVNSINGFNSAVTLTASALPSGVSASFSPNPITPPGGGTASATLLVSLSPFVTPTTFTLTVTGTSGSLSHSAPVSVTIVATSSAITNVIGQLLADGCIDNSGIANALTSKLTAAQSAINAGDLKTAINILSALINQLQAQRGKHITSTCTVGGVTFDPAAVLINDVQSLMDSLRLSATPSPVNGSVVTSTGAGISGATVSILDSSNNAVATAITDITGFYFFATTGVLTVGNSYTVKVTGFPAGFTASSPASQTFTWGGTAIMLSNFVLS